MPLAFRPHLLVVDDEPCIQEALSAALEDAYIYLIDGQSRRIGKVVNV